MPLKILRILLFPFSILYGCIVSVRSWLYDFNVLTSTSFKLPIITVGNLSVGGTGKTPQIEYLIRLLQDQYQIAVLSRGYKRKSKGFVLADAKTTVETLGDEPFQYHQKFKEIQVAVDANRVEGVSKILKNKPDTQIILLDDAYQHRKIKAGFQILLSSYDQLFYNDFMMPTGNLRELWWGKKRADVIVVTKCPQNLSEQEQQIIIQKIKPNSAQKVFFTAIKYANTVQGSAILPLTIFLQQKITLVTGIAKPKPLVDFLQNLGANFEHISYPDHHHFTAKDVEKIQAKAVHSKIVTTEKDFVRLEQHLKEVYYLPIETYFLNQVKLFDEQVLNFIAKF